MNNQNNFESVDLWTERLQQKNKRRAKFQKKNKQKTSKLFKLDEIDYFKERQNGTHQARS